MLVLGTYNIFLIMMKFYQNILYFQGKSQRAVGFAFRESIHEGDVAKLLSIKHYEVNGIFQFR